MHISSIIAFALATVTIRACDRCPHEGNFTGSLTFFADPADAYCNAGDQSGIYANIPIGFFDPPDESPCDGPITVTNPATNTTIQATVIGECSACAGDDIQLTTAGLQALSPDGNASGAPATVDWTFVG